MVSTGYMAKIEVLLATAAATRCRRASMMVFTKVLMALPLPLLAARVAAPLPADATSTGTRNPNKMDSHAVIEDMLFIWSRLLYQG